VVVVEFDLQEPSKVLFWCPEVVQLNTLLLAMLLSIKDGPVSDGGGVLEPGAKEAGSISYFRSHFSSCQDCCLFEFSVQAEFASRGAGANVVLMRRIGRAPPLALVGIQ
jgi:hypothetical protein